MRVETQFSIFLLNRPGVLSAVTEALAHAGVNLLALSISDAGEHGVLRVVCEDAEKTRQVLRDAHDRWTETDVLVTSIDNSPGAFANLADKFAANQINISYAYFSAAEDGRATSAIFKVSDLQKAIDLLG